MAKIIPSELSNALVPHRFLRQALIDGIDGDIISGGRLANGDAQGILEESATQNYVLGSKLRTRDGRTFRYCLNGAVALVAGYMTQGPAVVANYTEEVQTGYANAIGSTSGNVLITTGATPAANLFKDGWMLVNKVAGISQVRRILTSGSHATIIALTWEGGLEVATTATSEISLIQNPRKSVIVMPVTTPTNIPTGIPLIAVTAAYWFWAQVGGPAPCIVDTGETVVIGQPVGLPATSSVAGACGVNVTITTRWGRVMFVAAAAEPALIDLSLDR
jgi:hypothetical protein